MMRAVREGDLAKLGCLFDRHHRALFDFLTRMTGNRHTAEDLVQEVFLRVLKYRSTYRDDARFDLWMLRIARNARADYLAKQARLIPLPGDAVETPGSEPGLEDHLEQEGEAIRLRAALLKLRADRRELLILARYQEMKHEDIAALLGIHTSAVKVRIHRALKELREIFLRMSEKSPCHVKTSQRRSLII